MRVAVNAYLDLIQARNRRFTAEATNPLSSGDPPGSDELENLFVDRLRSAITKLKPRAVEILILHHKFDYTDAQIAKMLGTSRGAVAINLYRSPVYCWPVIAAHTRARCSLIDLG